MSQIENKVNYVIGIILIIQFVLCLVVAILYGNSRAVNETVFDYVSWTSYSVFVDSLLIFFSYFVLLNTMIPISLIVSIEGVKMSQSYFINRDQLMHS